MKTLTSTRHGRPVPYVLAVITVLTGIVLPAPGAQAAMPAETVQITPHFQAIDEDLGLILFVNSTREDYCTDEMVDWENAYLAWIEGGHVGEEPSYPGYEGMETVTATRMPVGTHNAWARWSATVPVELWTFDEGVFPDAIGVGPCTDSDEEGELVATGVGIWTASDNDSWGEPPQPGPRSNVIKDTITAELSGPGGDYAYRATIHSVFRNALSDDFRFLHGGWHSRLTALD